jgi:hypothetical protein
MMMERVLNKGRRLSIFPAFGDTSIEGAGGVQKKKDHNATTLVRRVV